MRYHIILIVLIMSFSGTLWFLQATRSSWCNDEYAHIPAGLYHWETGCMDAYRVNPPMPRMLAALPLLIDGPSIDWHRSESPYVRNEFQFGHTMVSENVDKMPRYLLWARSSVLIFFVIGLLSIMCWAARLYGKLAGATAGLMWAFNPDIITHSAVVASDLPAAATGMLLSYRFWVWLGKEDRPFPWSISLLTALPILCKFSWLILLPLMPMLTFTFDLLRRIRLSEKQESATSAVNESHGDGSQFHIRMLFHQGKFEVARDAMRLSLSFLLTIFIVNWFYGFEGTGKQLGSFQFISNSLANVDVRDGLTGNRFADGVLAKMPVPLPSSMVQGLDYLKWEFDRGLRCYLRGSWQRGGWWYFYLYALSVKMPVGYCLLICLGIFTMPWWSPHRNASRMLEWLPLLLAVFFVVMLSLNTGFTHHIRYVLPAYGFLFIVASRVTVVFPKRFAFALVAVCLSGTIWFHATHLGLAHTFFNPLAGGPNNGWRHLSFSNVDWGQSTYRMVDWIKEHPEQRPMTVLFRSSFGSPAQLVADQKDVFTNASWQQAGNDEYASPTRPGFYLISSYQMTLPQNRFFWDVEPIDQPCPDMLLFYLSPDEMAGVPSR